MTWQVRPARSPSPNVHTLAIVFIQLFLFHRCVVALPAEPPSDDVAQPPREPPSDDVARAAPPVEPSDDVALAAPLEPPERAIFNFNFFLFF